MIADDTTQVRSTPDPALPGLLREFHAGLPLAGDRGTLPDDRLLYLVSIIRNTPQPPPALSPGEWQGFLDLLRPHGIYPLLAYRLRAWPAACRPPRDVTAWLDRIFLYAARSMRAGRQIRAVVDALEAAGIESVKIVLGGLAPGDSCSIQK